MELDRGIGLWCVMVCYVDVNRYTGIGRSILYYAIFVMIVTLILLSRYLAGNTILNIRGFYHVLLGGHLILRRSYSHLKLDSAVLALLAGLFLNFLMHIVSWA